MTTIDLAEGRDTQTEALLVPAGDIAPSPAAAPVTGRPTAQAGAGWVAGFPCFLAVWFVVYAFVLSGLQEHGSQTRLYDRFRLQLAAATAPVGGQIRAGSPVALLSAPTGGLHNAVVVEGTTSRVLSTGPGHLANTPLPGQTGISVLFGRSVTFGGPFGSVTNMKVGDKLTVTTGQGVFTFRVYQIRLSASAKQRSIHADQAGLTLVTSTGHGWRSGWAPSHTVYVDTVMVKGTPQPAPEGRPAAVSKASGPMQGDPSGIVPFLFWIEGLAAATGLGLWAWRKWDRPQTWVLAVPVLIGLLWGTSGALLRFLPNLL